MTKHGFTNIILKLIIQSIHWKTPESPKMNKVRMSKSKLKAMLIIFFDIKGIIMT
jgi:hypothetical protein